MCRFYQAICGAACGLLLLCATGTSSYAAGPCLTEVLSKKKTLYVEFEDTKRTLDYQLPAGYPLSRSPRVIDFFCFWGYSWSVVAEDTKINLVPESANHRLRKPLEVWEANGPHYILRAGMDIRYTLPKIESGYEVTVPKGAVVVKIPEATSDSNVTESCILAEKLAVQINPPTNLQIGLTIDAQRVIERIPGSSNTGTALKINPKRAPVGEFVSLTIEKDGFDFSKAQLFVCLRPREQDGTSKKRWLDSKDVQLKAVQVGKAEVRFRIPDINEQGLHRAKPVELLVVARGADGELAEVVSTEFAVSSRGLAIICWIAAIVIPWLGAGLISARNEPGKLFRLNPILFVSGKYGGASLSLAQILLWTVLVFSASFYVLVVSGKLLDLTNEVLMLLGITGGSSVIAKITASSKDEKGRGIAAARPREPRWMDLFQTAGRPDLYKVQMALFTTLAAVFVTGKIYGTLEFPELPAGLLTLIGISNGVYLAAKATSKTVFEKLAEKSNELEKAKDEFEKRKAEAVEAEKQQQDAEKEKADAIKMRDTTKSQLDSEKDAAKKVALNELYEQQKASAQVAEKKYNEADQKKKDADEAKDAAEKTLKKIDDEFKTLKAEALK